MNSAVRSPDPSQTRSRQSGARLDRLLNNAYAPALTHISLVVLTAWLFGLLLTVPFWVAFIPSVMIGHRIGILLHEYFHGIPFRRYRHNLAVLSLFEGLMLMFGLLELVRGSHLAHHRWLNSELDPARGTFESAGSKRWPDLLLAHPAVQSLIYFIDAVRGKKPYVRGARILTGAALSVAVICLWRQFGHPEMIWKTLAISGFTSLVPVTIRGAIEHHSYLGDPNFANEYKVWLPMFNINRHIHHHLEPTRPWYLLDFKTGRPLPEGHYLTHWVRVYVSRDFVLMQPMGGAAPGRKTRTPRRKLDNPGAGKEERQAAEDRPIF